MNVYIPYTRLPSAYQEVEYIQSSGTQYFVVGNTFKTSYKIVLDFQMVTTGGDYIPLGVNSPSPYKKYGINAYGGYFKVVAGGSDWSNSKSEDTNRHTLTIDKNTVTVDGTDYSINYVDYTYSYGVGVFAYKEDDAMRYHSSNKLYSLQIYDENGDKIYDLVPCYRKSDNVIGMYDLVNSVFYTNQGTGTFSKGNDVTMSVLKNIYIGEYRWEPTADTLFYYEFENNFNDSSGKGNNITTTSGVGYTTQGGQYVANLTDGAGYIRIPSIQNSIGTGDFAVSFWLYPKQPGYYSGESYPMIFGMSLDTFPYNGPNIFFDPSGVNGLGDKVVWRTTSNNQTGGSKTASSLYNGWHHFVMTRNSGTTKCYIDGQQDATWSSDSISFPTTNESAYMGFALFAYNGNRQSWRNTGVMGDKLILESKGWTAQEISDYYNSTKSNYGL